MKSDFLKTCEETCDYLFRNASQDPFFKRVLTNPFLKKKSAEIRSQLFQVFEVYRPQATKDSNQHSSTYQAITWNLERGKNFEAILETFQISPHFKNVDLFFLTEVDWGMKRSGNRNIAAELGEALGYYAYFAPSYFNLTRGHGSERHVAGQNLYGLHGKALLSKYPLQNLRSVGMPNAINKLKSKEARLGEKRALVADLKNGENKITLACIHLDAFSSPKARMLQLSEVVKACAFETHVLLAGDWNTNSINSTSGVSLFKSLIHRLCVLGTQKMIREHFPHPYRKFDKHLFKMLRDHDFDYESLNEAGIGTFDLFENDHEMGAMVGDQFPRWLIKKVNDVIIRSGGLISLKLDWFAGRHLQAQNSKVLRLRKGTDYQHSQRPSDHYPIYLEFGL